MQPAIIIHGNCNRTGGDLEKPRVASVPLGGLRDGNKLARQLLALVRQPSGGGSEDSGGNALGNTRRQDSHNPNQKTKKKL